MRSPQTIGLARPRPGIAAFHRTPRPLGMSQASASGKPSPTPCRTDAPELWPVHTGFRRPGGVRADADGDDKSESRERGAVSCASLPTHEYNPSLTVDRSQLIRVGDRAPGMSRREAPCAARAAHLRFRVPSSRRCPWRRRSLRNRRLRRRRATPSAARTIDLKSPDGIALKASYFSPGRPGPGILLLHACNRDRSSWNGLATAAAARGFHVLALDYRGYGQSGGTKSDDPQQQQWIADREWPGDIDAAYAWLTSQHRRRQDPNRRGRCELRRGCKPCSSLDATLRSEP